VLLAKSKKKNPLFSHIDQFRRYTELPNKAGYSGQLLKFSCRCFILPFSYLTANPVCTWHNFTSKIPITLSLKSAHMEKQTTTQRKKLLSTVTRLLEGPMVFLGFVWLVLLNR
jgi:dTDP-4-dehydrorhamnose reductase